METIENNPLFSPSQKLEHYYNLKKFSDKYNLEHDSVYARILFKIGAYEVIAKNNYDTGISYTKSSIESNTPGKKRSSKNLAAKSYMNLALYYDNLGIYDKALNYYDSTIIVANTFPDTTLLIIKAKVYKANIYFHNGDYQKAIDESTSGINYSIKKNDLFINSELLLQRAQSLIFEDHLTEALQDIDVVISVAKSKNDFFNLSAALKTKGLVFEKKQDFLKANSFFKQSISYRVQGTDYLQLALDYIDYGNFYFNCLEDYKNAEKCYKKSISYGKKIKGSIVLSKANINIEEIYFNQKKYDIATNYIFEAFKQADINLNSNIFKNASSDKLNSIADKELALVLMNNKMNLLLKVFATKNSKEFLNSCIETALITDTLITKMRNEQTGTESKLYWRNYTRDFYTNAIEASYLANQPSLAFYFMEKSRAVLLNDKLNELDASSYLLKKDAAKQENYEIKIIEFQQKLSLFSDTSKQYQTLQLQLINIQNDYEHYTKSLEQKYPAYYEYKYADDVPSLKDLQNYLAKNNQSFVHYFIGDTVTYILAITSNNTKLIRLSQQEFNKKQLEDFLQLCANKEALNSYYNSFAVLSNSIYKNLFQKLQLPKGRVIICADAIVIPFDALCKDENGKIFLLKDYSFSYVYSARFLLKQFNNPTAVGNFVGFAPVSFAPYLKVQDLKNAADALQASGAYYKNDKLFVHQNASRNNFFKYASSYSVISVFSHARADTTDNEPVLFMQDSVIHLSELQLLNNPATKLVLLSACQTNVGKAATGEGIYSLARGFATAGIPSVSATLWKADEQTVYSISEKFNQYLSEGMSKDEALQKAKLYFIQNNNNEKLLPFFWANMILIGNADAIKLTTSNCYYWWWITGSCVLIALFFLIKAFFKKPTGKP